MSTGSRGRGSRGLPSAPTALWPFRRSLTVRAGLRIGALASAAALVVVALITTVLVLLFGHPLGLSIVGALFALVPLVGLLVCLGVSRRAAVAAGPGWVGVRFVRRWRVLDLSEVTVVRIGAPRSFAGPLGVPSGEPPLHLEDGQGHMLEIGSGALAPEIAEALIEGLGPDVSIAPEAAAMLERAEHDDGR